jgi:pyruvate dehydrogenase (quinone)
MMIGELATCMKYALPIKIVVLKNNAFGMIRWEQMMYLGNPEYGTELQPEDFAKLANAFGMESFHVESPRELPAICDRALRHDGPALIEAAVDPNEPLMPGKMKPEQAEKIGEALRRGQPNSRRIGLTLFRDAEEDPENAATIEAALPDQAPRQSPKVS